MDLHPRERFPIGRFDPCALWSRGLASCKNCRRVEIGVTWKFRLIFLPGNYISRFSHILYSISLFAVAFLRVGKYGAIFIFDCLGPSTGMTDRTFLFNSPPVHSMARLGSVHRSWHGLDPVRGHRTSFPDFGMVHGILQAVFGRF